MHTAAQRVDFTKRFHERPPRSACALLGSWPPAARAARPPGVAHFKSLPLVVLRRCRHLNPRLSWRAALPALVVVAGLGALPPTLHAESGNEDASPEPAAEPTPSAPHSEPKPEEPPRPPRVDLSQLRVVDGKAHAKTSTGELAELTLDVKLQAGAERLLRRAKPARGAIVVTHLASGKVLALAEVSRDKLGGGRLALSYAAPSASLFKLVTAAALLEHGKLAPGRTVCTQGGERRIDRQHLEAPKAGAALCAPFGSALGHSRNAVFAQLATRYLMRDQLAETAAQLGFDQPLAFDQPAHMGHVELPYGDLEFARAAAGFGETSLTPLGAAHLVSLVAQRGRASELLLVERAGAYQAPAKLRLGEQRIQRETARLLTRMMEITVSGGTSLEAFSRPDGKSHLPNIRVAGKTGTLAAKDGQTTSWFAGFAPSRAPQVAVSVLLVNDVVWHFKANEVARDVLRLVFAERPGVTDPFAPEAARRLTASATP